MSEITACFQWDGEALHPVPHHRDRCAEHFTAGRRYWLSTDKGRSNKSHRHEFAFVDNAFDNLPEHLAGRDFAVDAKTLRKHCLIMTRWCHASTHATAAPREAQKLAATLRTALTAAHGYCIVNVDGLIVTALTPMSQSKKAMGARDFQRSKQDVLEYLAVLIGVPAAQLKEARAA